jgi:glycosyltransferase involved in cell wall biosynthesis
VKILQVLAGAAHGGAETAFVDMCIALSESGEEIEVVTRDNPIRVPRLEAAGIKVHKLRFGSVTDVYTPWRMKKIIKEFKPQIVQTWMSRAAQKTPNCRGDKSVPRYLVVSRLGGYYKVKHFKNTDFFTTITPDIKNFLIREGVPENKVRHINNFAETDEVVKPIKRSEFDTPEDAPLLLGLGRLHSAKAFDTLMAALSLVPEAWLWIAGEGPLREELEATSKELGVSERVRFLGWRDDRAALFQASDICVFSSRYEPFGTVFVQSWAQKTPLVTTDADGPRQYVRDGEDGLVVPVDDAEAMAKAIKRIIDDKKLEKNLIENGYKRYLNEFTKENTVHEYLNFYIEILEQQNLLQKAV